MNRLPQALARLERDRRGVTMIEFALCLPLLVILTLWAFELINFVIVRQQISQLALQVADNASRIGSQNTVQTQIDEKQINDLFIGSNLQSGKLDLARNGRVILSSLEVDPDTPHGQYIHWQRCFGNLVATSDYGKEGDGKGTTAVAGMGTAKGRVTAMKFVPAMFVQISYQYQPIVSPYFAPGGRMDEIAAMLVRDNRDTSGAGVNPVDGVPPSKCD